MLKVNSFIYIYLIFAMISIPNVGGGIAGIVSVNWLKTTFLLVITLILLFVTLINRGEIFKLKINKKNKYILSSLIWPIFISISFLWAQYPLESFRFINSYLFAAIFPLLVYNSYVKTDKVLYYLYVGIIMFLILTIAFIPFQNLIWGYREEYYLQGISGRHFSKFLLVFIIIFIINVLNNKSNSLKNMFYLPKTVLFVSCILLLLVLQRGAILSLVIGIVFILTIKYTKSLKSYFKLIIYTTLIIILSLSVFSSDRFLEYAFYSRGHAALFVDSALKFDFETALSTIRDRGRLYWLGIVVSNYNYSLFGIGIGTIAVDLEYLTGWTGGLHNDIVQYIYEGGFVGFWFYIMMWFVFFKISIKYKDSNDPLTSVMSYTLGGYAAALLAWSFISQVFTYADMNIMFLFLLMVLILKRTNPYKIGKLKKLNS